MVEDTGVVSFGVGPTCFMRNIPWDSLRVNGEHRLEEIMEGD